MNFAHEINASGVLCMSSIIYSMDGDRVELILPQTISWVH